uniref:F-box/FBD/LRR-repeat protein n=1 Tax=Anisakis simplex TaxID=6269 RepID=A0A0M3J6E4_ANISI
LHSNYCANESIPSYYMEFKQNLNTANIENLQEDYMDNEKFRFNVQLAVCSHRMAQAELDEVADQFSNSPHFSSNYPPKIFQFKLLILKLLIFQHLSLPSRKILCKEIMWESKLSVLLPTQMVKLFLKWSHEMKLQMESRLWSMPQEQIDCLHNCLRCISSNQETYVNSLEFLESYAGPSFRPSIEKFRVAFGAVPTNLHVQQFSVENHVHSYITVGTASAIPLRFHGGLSLDHILDSRFFHRRRVLLDAKATIGALSRRIETDWHIASFGSIDKTGVQLLADIKQVILHENLIDLISSFPGVGILVDLLCEWGRLQTAHGRIIDKVSSCNLFVLYSILIS